MGRYVLGKVSFTPRSEWDPNTQYEYLDVVLYNGSGYVAKQDNKGVKPQSTENDYWMLIVERGTLKSASVVVEDDDDGSGEPNVSLSWVEDPDDSEGGLMAQFTFRNIKGKQGEKGEPNITEAHKVILKADSWSEELTQTVAVSGIDVDETTQIIDWVSSAASRKDCNNAGIECIAQADNSLTFECSTKPTTDLTIFVTIEQVKMIDDTVD